MGNSLLTICAVILLSAAPAFTQQKDPKHFYNRDFASDVGKGGNSGQIGMPPLPTPSVQSSAQSSPPVSPSMDLEKNIERLEDVKSEIIKKQMAEGRGVPIQYIGVILNAVDQEHYWARLKELADLVLEKQIPISVVYSVGPSGKVKDLKVAATLDSFGRVSRTVKEAPAKYQVKFSPAWIFGTKDGEIVVEGDEPLSSWINSRNEFVVQP